MGHRALVVYDVLDHYVVAHSHWGAQNLRLEETITADSLRAGAYPERGLISSIADHFIDGGVEDLHVGGNRGDKDVDPPHGLMEQPCTLGDVLAQHYSPGYEAVYVADVTLRNRVPVGASLVDSFEDLESHVRSVDVTGYRTMPLPDIDGADRVADGLEPDVLVYRGSRDIGDEIARQSWNMREQVDEGTFSPESGVDVAVRQMARTVHERGGRIPEWSPVASDIDVDVARPGLVGKVRNAVSRITG